MFVCVRGDKTLNLRGWRKLKRPVLFGMAFARAQDETELCVQEGAVQTGWFSVSLSLFEHDRVIKGEPELRVSQLFCRVLLLVSRTE